MNAHCGYWSMRSSRHVWTTATDCLRTAAWPFVNGFSKFRTALLVWYVQNLLLATLHHCCAGYTGYWLYKLCVLMFDVFHGTAPEYLTDLCSRCSNRVSNHQHTEISLCGRQGHELPTARLLSQVPQPGTHCQSTSGPFSHTLHSVVILKLTYSLRDLTVTFILLVLCTYFNYFN